MGTVIRLLEPGARGRHADGGVPAGPGVSLAWMVVLIPWCPAVLAFEFWSQLFAAHAAALHCSQAEDSPGHAEIARERQASAAGKVVPMAEFKARRVSS